MKFNVLAKLPLVSENTELVDKGLVEQVVLNEILPVVDAIKEEK